MTFDEDIYVHNPSAMVLDIDNFDFNSLDKDEDFEQPGVKEPSKFDVSEDDFEFDEDGENDFDIDEDEEETEEKFVPSDIDELNDDYVFKVNGEDIRKADLIEKLNAANEYKARQVKLDKYYENFENIDRQMNAAFVSLYTETDKNIQRKRAKMEDPSITDSEYGQLHRELKALEQNKEKLNEKVQEFELQKVERERQRELANIENINNEMTKKYGEAWVDTIAPAITQYVVDNGVASPEFRKALSPALVELIIKANKFDQMSKRSKATVEEKMKKTTTPTSTATKKTAGKVSGGKRKAVEQLMSKDPSAAYNFIED